MRRIYLDHQTLTSPYPEVVEAVSECLRGVAASPSGIHSPAKAARDAVDAARRELLEFMGAADSDGDVIFTGTGTEAVNLAILGGARANQRFGKHIISSRIEHPAVLNSLEHLKQEGFQVDLIGTDERGRLDLDSLPGLVRKDTILMCFGLANAELGTIQFLESVGELARRQAIPFFVDATIGPGRMLLDLSSLSADLVALAPSSFGGSVGVGALIKRSQVLLQPILFGGLQEQELRPGEENVPAIVGAGVAAGQTRERLASNLDALRQAQRILWEMIQSKISGVQLLGTELGEERMAHHLSVLIEGVEAEGLVLFADMRGLAISTAGGCLSRQRDAFYVLSEVGLDREAARQTIGLGVGLETSEAELEEAVKILAGGVERLRSMNPGMDLGL